MHDTSDARCARVCPARSRHPREVCLSPPIGGGTRHTGSSLANQECRGHNELVARWAAGPQTDRLLPHRGPLKDRLDEVSGSYGACAPKVRQVRQQGEIR